MAKRPRKSVAAVAALARRPLLPFPMVGDPPEARGCGWAKRQAVLYAHWKKSKEAAQ